MTPFGQKVAITTKITDEARLIDTRFRLNEKDTVSLSGTIMNGRLYSTDCGCGSYKFTRQ